jgi:hypothetical protein
MDDSTQFSPEELLLFEQIAQDTIKDHQILKKRKRVARDYENSVWGKMLRHPEIGIEGSFTNLKFRTRFRTPYAFFRDILIPECRLRGVLVNQRTSRISLELKVMVALRILGRDAVSDSCEELSEIARSTCNDIFIQFVAQFNAAFYDDVIKPPTGDNLLHVMETYRKLGFPGCVGSIDCTHVKWRQCPKSLRFECSGKEGYPTLSFEVRFNIYIL